MDINFNELMKEAGEGFQPVPPGPYTVECEKAEAVKSSTNKPQIRVTLRILGGPHNGRKLFDQFTLTAGNPAALGFFFDNCAAFGLDRAFFSGLNMQDPMPYVAQMLMGRQANVAVKMDVYQGVERNKVAQYRPIAGGQQPANMPQQGVPGGVPGYPAAPMGAMPVAPQQMPPAPQPQFPPQGPPPGFPPQQPYAPEQPQPPVAPQPPQMPGQFPQVPQPQGVPPVQEPQAPWQQQPQQPAPQQYPQEYPQQMPPQQPQYPQQPVAPGEQQTQPQQAPTWSPSGPPPGYVDPNQQQAPQAPPAPQGVPPMPGVPGRSI
jgi:hypothetical protein